MAELTPPLHRYTGLRLGTEQFRAIVFLRWRIFANAFRRKGGVAELIGRLLLLPLVGVLVLLPSMGAGFLAWYLAMHGTLQYLPYLFWATFALTQLLNINLGQPGTTFDPTELIRFPLSLRHYVLVRLCFGLLSPANMVVLLMSGAIFVGFTVDRPQLWPWTLLATGVFALANVLFSRMLFAWVDRWLSTRRSREVFTALVFLGSLVFQYLNVTLNPGFQRGNARALTPEKLAHAHAVAQSFHPWLQWFPPEMAGSALQAAERHQTGSFTFAITVLLLYAALFLAIYSVRTKTEYAGENLSDTANAVRREQTSAVVAHAPVSLPKPSASRTGFRELVPPSLGPLLAKELLLLRRNTGLLYGIVAPTVMVFLFAGRLSMRGNSHWLLLVAVGYALLGLAPMSYNIFGLEGPGAQLYFMAPVPLREVFLAKNLMQFLMALFEVGAVTAIIALVSARPSLMDSCFVVLWAAGALLLNTAVGNLRSVSAPKKVKPGRAMNRSQSQLSVWLSLGMLAASFGLGALFVWLGTLTHRAWLSLLLAALFAATALFAYMQALGGIEQYAMLRRETLLEELGKKS